MTDMLNRLSNDILGQTHDGLTKPSYVADEHGVGIIHLGIGAFHRAHQAVYTDKILSKDGGDWRIMGVSLRSGTIRDQLNPQNGLYTLAIKDGDQTHYEIISSVAGVLVAPENPTAVLDLIATETTKIVTLTITEKGYCQDPATNALDLNNTDIQHDLKHESSPKTALGYICSGLKLRYESHRQPLTIMSCDNLPSNGRVLEDLILEFASINDSDFADWIKQNISFPATMIDRIVPATTPEDRADFTTATGLIDEGLVKGEPFTQWVIEDKFVTDRPAWEKVGVQFVKDVAPYEDAKLRLLNGSHSALAYLGFLAGYKYIHEAMENSAFNDFADHLMKKEAAVSLTPPAELDLIEYADELKARYENAALQHQTYQIAMDGSQKLPQRLLETIKHNIKSNLPHDACTLAVAGWLCYISRIDSKGSETEIQDPLAPKFAEISTKNSPNAEQLVCAYLEVREVFGTALPKEETFKSRLIFWLNHLLKNGSEKTVSFFIQQLKG